MTDENQTFNVDPNAENTPGIQAEKNPLNTGNGSETATPANIQGDNTQAQKVDLSNTISTQAPIQEQAPQMAQMMPEAPVQEMAPAMEAPIMPEYPAQEQAPQMAQMIPEAPTPQMYPTTEPQIAPTEELATKTSFFTKKNIIIMASAGLAIIVVIIIILVLTGGNKNATTDTTQIQDIPKNTLTEEAPPGVSNPFGDTTEATTDTVIPTEVTNPFGDTTVDSTVENTNELNNLNDTIENIEDLGPPVLDIETTNPETTVPVPRVAR